MIYLLVIVEFFATLRRAARDTEFQVLLGTLIIVLSVGTLFYRITEQWSWVDSLYFTVVTLATVGYGDFAPTTTVSKLFTIVYIFIGIGLIVAFAQRIAREVLDTRSRRRLRRRRGQADDEEEGEVNDNEASLQRG